jgi:hypothetical protein
MVDRTQRVRCIAQTLGDELGIFGLAPFGDSVAAQRVDTLGASRACDLVADANRIVEFTFPL